MGNIRIKRSILILLNVIFLGYIILGDIKSDTYDAVHPAFPFTAKEELVPCEAVINIDIQMILAALCSSSTIPGDLANLPKPSCYILPTGSLDVFSIEDLNFIVIDYWDPLPVLGLYESYSKTIYLVDNGNIGQVYRHELQHYFLHKVYKTADPGHNHSVWEACEPAVYSRGGN